MSSLDEFLNIDTPENVAFNYKIAGIGSRFLAAVIDSLIIGVLLFVVNLTMVLIAYGSPAEFLDFETTTAAWIFALFGLFSFAILWGYYIFFELAWNGQSPGKRKVGLRVVQTSGRPISLVDTTVRNLVRLIDFLPVSYGVGVISMFIDDKSRRLGDLAAGTLVVHDQTEVSMDSLEQESETYIFAHPVIKRLLPLPVDRLSQNDVRMAEKFLERQKDLPNRFVIGGDILDRLFSKMELPEPEKPGNFRHKIMVIQAVVEVYRKGRM